MFHRLIIPASVVFIILAVTGFTQTTTQPKRQPAQGDLKVGDTAPDFTIKDLEGKVTTTLSKLKGKPVVLIFGSCT
jgi:cytochrome oxidase Cu insertion factor (SCO1/SenC/PrrC family)